MASQVPMMFPKILWPNLFEEVEKKPMNMDYNQYQELLDAALKVAEGLEKLPIRNEKRIRQANKIYQYIGGFTFDFQEPNEDTRDAVSDQGDTTDPSAS